MKTDDQWEARCRRCGSCCYEKIEYEGNVYYTDRPCEKLDVETRLCTVYEQRETLRPGCVRLTPEIVARGILPADCPYVADLPDYQSPCCFSGDDEDSSSSQS